MTCTYQIIITREVQVGENEVSTKVKTVRKRQTKKKAEEGPLEERTKGSKLRIGAHVSIAGGKPASSAIMASMV
jgi:AP endonuclease-1